ELAKLREELSRLRANPPASADLGARVDDLVASWAARPDVRGYASGGQLDVLWAGNRGQCDGLALMAAINPAERSELIFKAVHNAQPLTQTEYGERVKQLTQQISELSYVAAALVERVGGDHDVHAEPHHILGVRVEAMETAAA